MSQVCIKLLQLLCVVFYPLSVCAQFGNYAHEKAFIKHLRVEKLSEENIFLLSHLSDSSNYDLINLELGWTYHQLNNIDSAYKYYRRVPLQMIITSHFIKDYSKVLFSLSKFETLEKLIQNNDLHYFKDSLQKIKVSLTLMQRGYNKNEIEYLQLPDYLKTTYQDYTNISRKSGLLAGSLSTILPGLGKVYIGKSSDGLSMFIVNLALGLQAFEAYKNAEIYQPRFILFGSAFTIFYLGNIIGSISGLKKLKNDHKKQMNYEITNYYLDDYHNYPNQY